MARQNSFCASKRGDDLIDTISSERIIPPARIAAQGILPPKRKMEYNYNPHLTPSLRFDDSGKIDELLEKARRGPLSTEDLKILSEALQAPRPMA